MTDEIDVSAEIAILADLVRLDADRRKVDALTPPSPPRWVQASEWAQKPVPPRHQVAIEAAIENPLHEAIRAQIIIVGWRLYALGGLDAMNVAWRRTTDTAASHTDGRAPVSAIASLRWVLPSIIRGQSAARIRRSVGMERAGPCSASSRSVRSRLRYG